MIVVFFKLSYVQTDGTTPYMVSQTMLGVVGSVDRFQTSRNNSQKHATGCENGRNM